MSFASTGTKGKYDIVLLLNEFSASASEVFAASLYENDLATIIGTKSYGNGTIQSVSKLETGGAIKYTMGYYLTPKGFPQKTHFTLLFVLKNERNFSTKTIINL